MFRAKNLFRRWCVLCLCLVVVLLSGLIGQSEAKMASTYAGNPPGSQNLPGSQTGEQPGGPNPPIGQAGDPPGGPNPPGSQTGELPVGPNPPVGQAADPPGIQQGDPVGILYFRYRPNINRWVVGVHNGIALANLFQGMPIVPLGHYSNAAFQERVLCFHKPTLNDTAGGYRRIATESYRSPYTNEVPIGYEAGGQVHNAAFGNFKPDPATGDPNPQTIYNANQAITFLHSNPGRTGTLTYGHWNIERSTATSGSYRLVWQVASRSNVTQIERLTVINNTCGA